MALMIAKETTNQPTKETYHASSYQQNDGKARWLPSYQYQHGYQSLLYQDEQFGRHHLPDLLFPLYAEIVPEKHARCASTEQ
jgi:hypothetical protein